MDALCSISRRGAPAQLAPLLQVDRVREEIDRLGPGGQNALHLAVWRNHGGLVEALLEAGADPNARDSESGWSPLHKALYWGHLRLAGMLLAADASPDLPDWRGRGPLDLLSAELRQYLGPGGPGDVFAFGSGANYCLGTGSTRPELHPTRVEGLHDAQAAALSASKFHSCALTLEGQLYTWGWGRGGRLGHPEAHVHSGESAVIAPRLVAALGRRAVAAVAAAKHHTVLCTTAGEVFTFGSNRYGQLGYAGDTQPTPKRVAALRGTRTVAVAAANKHSVAVSAGGEVFTWGGNAVGQLGYGSVDSTSNAAPRLVEAMKGRRVVMAAAAKRHTLVLTAEGEVYTWGHRGVSPRRVLLAGARDTATASGEPLRFHRGHGDVARPSAAAVAAGAAHSSVLTTTGVVLCWRSADPALQVQEVRGPLAGQRCVALSAGKYRTAAVTESGDVYMWEGRSDYFPAEGRTPGSGSKKGSARGARPIPPRPPLGGGPGGAEASASPGGGSYGASPGAGSYGSLSRRGSHFERYFAEREAAAAGFTGPASLGPRGATPPSARGGGGVHMPGRAGATGAGTVDHFVPILPQRVEGLKRVVHVAVGEKHSLAVQRWSAAQLAGLPHMPWLASDARGVSAHAHAPDSAAVLYTRVADGEEGGLLTTPRSAGGGDLSAEPSAAELSAPASPEPPFSPMRPRSRRRQGADGNSVGAPSLQRLAEEVVARQLVDPRTALQVLEYADVAGASMLRSYCLSVALCNLDAVLIEARGAFEALPPHLLDEMERLWKLRLVGSEPADGEGAAARGAATERDEAGVAPAPAGPEESASPVAIQWLSSLGSTLQPGRRPSAAPPALGEQGWCNAEEDSAASMRASPASAVSLGLALTGESSFRGHEFEATADAAGRLKRTLHKKLQQIGSLEARAAGGTALDAQQRAKVAARPVVEAALAALEGGMAVAEVQSILRAGTDAAACEAPAVAAASRGSISKGGKAKGKGGSRAKGTSAASEASELTTQLTELALAEPSGLLDTPSRGAAEAAKLPAAPADGAAEPVNSMFGASPPASALLPAFGLGERPMQQQQQQHSRASDHSAATGAPGASPASPPMTTQVGFATRSDVMPAEQQPPRSSGKVRDSSSRAKRKGGLSMFLRGDLDHNSATPSSRVATPPPAAAAASPGPAWARPAATPPPTSLREILESEARTPASAGKHASGSTTPGVGAPRGRTPPPTAAIDGAPLRMSLASFMQQSSPMAIAAQQQQQQKGPAWGGAAGASPPMRGASLLAIQQEQQKAAAASAALPRAVSAHGSSPPASRRVAAGAPAWRPLAGADASAAAGAAALLGTSPTGSSLVSGGSPGGFSAAPAPTVSRWYLPDEARAAQKSLAAIQTEEKAMAELAKMYGEGNVRVVSKRMPRAPAPGGGAPPQPRRLGHDHEPRAGAASAAGGRGGGSRQQRRQHQ